MLTFPPCNDISWTQKPRMNNLPQPESPLVLFETEKQSAEDHTVPATPQTSRGRTAWLRTLCLTLCASLCAGLLIGTINPTTVSATEVQFIEDFALAKNRATALARLIPGTDDYYYFHCLNHQHLEQFEDVETLITTWVKRHGETARVREIRHRQALLTYRADPKATLAYLKQQLNLHFNHQRDQLDKRPNLPTQLNPAAISGDVFYKNALARHRDLSGFEDRALDRLLGKELTNDQRRMLLGRLTRPDVPGLVLAIHADLNYRNSGGFGSLQIHRALLRSQLDELLALQPALRNHQPFVETYLTKLLPGNDVDVQQQPEEHLAHLERLWEFVQTLSPQHNSLKAHVLYHRLLYDRGQGEFNKQRFLTYLKLPRQIGYMAVEYLQQPKLQGMLADLQRDYSAVTAHQPIVSDEPLVRSFLMHFFKTEADRKPYEQYINSEYLKHLFAETKILYGLGDAEQWASLLPPAKFQELRERVDLKFAFTNKQDFAPGDRVSLDLDVKNVKTLIVKVFEINTQSWYRRALRELDTDINLDGLVPNLEQTFEYEEGPLRQVRRHFDFPSLKDRGVYVIDFIGNGSSSRAVIRKGRLHYLVRTSSAGQVFTVLNSDAEIVPNATLWLQGHEYKADKTGTIHVPFSTNPGRQAIVLGDGEFHSVAHFTHQSEAYNLQAGFHVDREQLPKRATAELAIRPRLRLGQQPVTLELLEDTTLTISAVDIDGTAVTQQFRGDDVKLTGSGETIVKFQVPDRLASLSMTLQATVKNVSQGSPNNVAASHTLQVNQILKSDKIQDLFLAKYGENYVIELLGRTGEALAARPVQLQFKHPDFRDTVRLTLQTNDAGQVVLGPLSQMESVRADAPQVSQTWQLPRNRHSHLATRHAAVGETLFVPLPPGTTEVTRDDVSLLEVRKGTFVKDHFDLSVVRKGLLEITDLPAGDFDLLLKNLGQKITIRVTAGAYKNGFVVGEHRRLQVIDSQPLQIGKVDVTDKQISVALVHSSKAARVHVIATRYQPPWTAQEDLTAVSVPQPMWLTTPFAHAAYVEGRNIGEEYRYIIERRYAPKFPGNMLERPSWLLNPWAVRDTQTDQRDAEEGDEFGDKGGFGGGMGGEGKDKRVRQSGTVDASNLDFLPEQSVVLWNLPVDKNGNVKIDREQLGDHTCVQIVAVDPAAVATQYVTLPASERKFRDLRLASSLDPTKHFALQKQVTVLAGGKKFELAHLETAEFEAYDSLNSLYSLYSTLSTNGDWQKFRFLVEWPSLSDKDKLEKFSEFTCHEVNFFLYHKDPQFFAKVVKPYIQNKMAKTFMDFWLTDADLTAYLQPWAYRQLNPVERILLSQRMRDEQRYTQQHLADLLELQQRNPEQIDRLFATAVRGSSLSTGDRFGFDDAKKNADRSRLAEEKQFGQNANGITLSANGGIIDEATTWSAPAVPGMADAPSAPPMAKKPGERDAKKRKSESKSESSSRRNKKLQYEWSYQHGDHDGDMLMSELRERESARQYFRKLDKTKEWIENHYWHLSLANSGPDVVPVNAFWVDYAKHPAGKPFFSEHIAESANNLHEMLMALAVIDLPFKPAEHQVNFADSTMQLTPGSPLVVFHEQIETAQVEKNTPILVSQNFYRQDDPHRYEKGQQVDKYITDEFLVHTVYGGKVVVTNPTSATQKLNVLVQIPVGSMPVAGSKRLRSVQLTLQPFHTQTVEYHFYFPLAGDFAHYPVQVARDESVVAFTAAHKFHVVDEPTKLDRESWEFVSQHADEDVVLTFLKEQNVERIDLSRIAFRMQDKAFFNRTIEILQRRHAYNDVLWSYGLLHNDAAVIAEYLKSANGFVQQCGDYLDSPLVTIDPTIRRTYQHRDYAPLVNARKHRLGREHEILNDRFSEHYHHLLRILSYRRQLTDEDKLAVVYYMLLQDRIGEALDFFAQVNVDTVPMRLQYDYCAAYLAMYQGDAALAGQIAKTHSDHPVDRWRNRFVSVSQQVNEINGGDIQIVDEKDRDQTQTQLAAKSGNFTVDLTGDTVVVQYANLSEVQVQYYLMDVELLFSRNPFVQAGTDRFSYIKPNQTATVKLPGKQQQVQFRIPDELRSRNVLVQVVGAGQTSAQAYYANTLNVSVTENYGQLAVRNARSGRPESTVYVKVYARMKDGDVKFFKDGYTDLRGRFDYVSLSTNELDNVAKFSLLVLSDEHGAIVREAAPPKR